MTTKYSNMAEYFDYRGRRFAEKCTNCGDCLEVCPLFPLTKFAHKGPQAIIEKITGLLRGGEVSEEAYDMLCSCSGACGLCAKACPEKLIPYSAFMSALVKVHKAGRKAHPLNYQYMPGHRYNFAHVFSALQIKPSETRWIKKVPDNPNPVDVVFFTGCSPMGTPHTLLETVDILDRMGIDFVALAGGDLCCGTAAMLWGDAEAAQQMGQNFVSAIAAFRPKKAVFFCTGCHLTCLGTLPRFMSVPFLSYELSQFLVENLDRIPFKRRIDKVVTMHDSCSVARLGTFELQRQLLRAIPGITLVEMEHNRDDALCCGGTAKTMRPEITGPMRRAPLEEAKATGAEIMATSCTGCIASFTPLEDEYPFEVRSYINLLAEAVGVTHENRFSKYAKSRNAAGVIAEARDYIAASDFTTEELKRILPDYLNRFCPKDVGDSRHLEQANRPESPFR
ncbi:MAG: (Fe-S)-binding protein [Chloroflexi bacterium]|nr:(Fe-S)-binding protein [Chloroflexota bacterium]